jgi:hypothetical protein
MKRNLSIALFALFCISSFLSCNDGDQNNLAQENKADLSKASLANGSNQHAKAGDSVWIFINHIKSDQRNNFETLVHEVFFDSSAKLPEQERRVFQETRILHPTEPEKDGSYSYIFLMDPVVPGGEYDIERLMIKIYGEEKAKDYLKRWSEVESAEQTGYRLVQSRH